MSVWNMGLAKVSQLDSRACTLHVFILVIFASIHGCFLPLQGFLQMLAAAA